MRPFLLFLTLLSAVIWLACGADMIQTADDAWEAFQGLLACLCGVLLMLVFVYFVASGQAKKVRE